MVKSFFRCIDLLLLCLEVRKVLDELLATLSKISSPLVHVQCNGQLRNRRRIDGETGTCGQSVHLLGAGLEELDKDLDLKAHLFGLRARLAAPVNQGLIHESFQEGKEGSATLPEDLEGGLTRACKRPIARACWAKRVLEELSETEWNGLRNAKEKAAIETDVVVDVNDFAYSRKA